MPLVTCPDCGKQVSDQAPACPHCGRPLRTPQKGPATAPMQVTIKRKTSRATWGCFVLMALGVVLYVVVDSTGPRSSRQSAGSRFETKTDPRTGQRYLAMPSYTVPAPTDLRPAIHVRALLSTPATGVKGQLVKQLGPRSNPTYDAKTTTWRAKADVGHVEVTVYRGKVIGVVVFCEPPIRDWAAALAVIDLQPATTLPTTDAIGAVHWTRVFQGIDEVYGLHKPDGQPPISIIGVIPDKNLEDEWSREG